MPLQMTSTIDYGLHRSTLNTTTKDTRAENVQHLCPDGAAAHADRQPRGRDLKAAISPPQGNWLYSVTVKPGDTRFTADFDEQQRNVAEFHKLRTSGKPSSA